MRRVYPCVVLPVACDGTTLVEAFKETRYWENDENMCVFFAALL